MGSTTSSMSSSPKTQESKDQFIPPEDEELLIHMMRGKCKKTLIDASDCIIEDYKNNEKVKNKCDEVALDFVECMEANQDHYGDILQEIDNSPDVDDQIFEKVRVLTEKECWYCLYMKQGECKETYTNWEKCVEEAKKNDEDIATKCVEATSAFKKCIEADQDYCSREKSCCQETKNFEVAKQSFVKS